MKTEYDQEIKKSAKMYASEKLGFLLVVDVFVGIFLAIFIIARVIG